MNSTNQTVPEVINELMFIALAKPDGLDVTVEYHGNTDCVYIRVMPTDFDYRKETTESYSAAALLRETVYLDFSNPLKKLVSAKEKLLSLIDTKQEKQEVAA